MICKPDCEICKGSGYTRQDLPKDDPDFGKLKLCPNVDRFKLPGLQPIGLTPEDATREWADVLDRHNAKAAVDVVKMVINQGHGWVYLHGEWGLAKTLILKIATVDAAKRGMEAGYTRMVDIIKHLRSAFDSEHPSYESQSRLERFTKMKFLAIDEFDRINETKWVSEQRFDLMDSRYVEATRQKSITIMASNTSPRDFKANLGYLRDRIFDGRFHVIELIGTSFRPGASYE